MDFHSLSRRELQALCKINKIPANMTNGAMADALKALEFVEGIEEFLKPSESETKESSIESPKKSEKTLCIAPRTSCRTTTRRKTMTDEPESLQTLTRSLRTTRKTSAGEVEVAKIDMAETPAATAPTTRRRATGGSVRRKIEISSNESEEIETSSKEKKDLHESSAVGMTSRRRGVKETSNVKHVYSTRRSTRLAEKSVDEKDNSEVIKIDSFSEEIDESLEMNSKESTENNGFDLKTSSGYVKDVPEEESKNGGDFEVDIKEEEANDIESDVALSSKVEELINLEEKTSDDNQGFDLTTSSRKGDAEDVPEEKLKNDGEEEANDIAIDVALSSDVEERINVERKTSYDNTALGDGIEICPEVDSEMSDKIDVHCVDDGLEKLDLEIEVQENNGYEDVYASEAAKDEGSEFVVDEVAEVEGCNNVEIQSRSCETEGKLESENGKILGFVENITKILGSVEKIQEILGSDVDIKNDAADNSIVVLQNAEATCADKNVNSELTSYIQDDTEEYFVAPQNVMVQKSYLNDFSVKSTTVFAENFKVEMSGLKSDFSEDAANPMVNPTSVTPLKNKNSMSTTLKISADNRTPRTAKRVINISDNKENVDTGRKLVLIKEEKPKQKDYNQKQLEDFSMRQLTKMFKEKCEITKNKSKTEDIKAATTRPALRTLSENCRVAGPQN